MAQPLVLTQADTNSTRGVAVGQDVLVKLEENPTTGYRWSLSSEPAGAIEVLDSNNTPGGSAPGAGGQREFHLRASTPGTVHLYLKLWREWQGEGSVLERLEFTLPVGQ